MLKQGHGRIYCLVVYYYIACKYHIWGIILFFILFTLFAISVTKFLFFWLISITRKHEIDDELGTPFRDIRFPGVKKKEHVPEFRGSSGKVLSDKKTLISKDSFSERATAKEKWDLSEKEDVKLKRSGNTSSGLDSSRKVKESDASKKPSRGSMIADATGVKRFGQGSKTSLGDRLFSLMKSSEGKSGKQELLTSEPDDTLKHKDYTKKLSSDIPSLDADAERR